MNRGAFSLAEMMIALAILAMGLLVIGAALPIGVSYTQQSMSISLGQDAVEHALDLIEQNVCLYNRVYPKGGIQGNNRPECEPGLFQPRIPPGPGEGTFVEGYEPIIKVRPLYTRAVVSTPGRLYGQEAELNLTGGVHVEEVVRTWLRTAGGDTKECDNGTPWMRWALSSACTVYPPITPDTDWTTIDFFQRPYEPRQLTVPNSPSRPGVETLKVLERRLSWTAFYRRVSYAPGSDPGLYEFIVVAIRRPSERHRFPLQAANTAGKYADGAGLGAHSSSVVGASGLDFSAPVPWLVSFTALPTPPRNFDQTNGAPLMVGQAPATLKFKCGIDRSALFPVGTIFIPARNDFKPSFTDLQADPSLLVGFGPPSPTALPIYEVVERPDDTTILVKYNGYYPMQGKPGVTALGTPAAGDWPAWVIPPAYENRDSGGNPIAPDECHIVAVGRRYIHLRRVP